MNSDANSYTVWNEVADVLPINAEVTVNARDFAVAVSFLRVFFQTNQHLATVRSIDLVARWSDLASAEIARHQE